MLKEIEDLLNLIEDNTAAKKLEIAVDILKKSKGIISCVSLIPKSISIVADKNEYEQDQKLLGHNWIFNGKYDEMCEYIKNIKNINVSVRYQNKKHEKDLEWIKSNNTTTVDGLQKEIESIKYKIINSINKGKGFCFIINPIEKTKEKIDLTIDDNSICIAVRLLKKYQNDLGELMMKQPIE